MRRFYWQIWLVGLVVQAAACSRDNLPIPPLLGQHLQEDNVTVDQGSTLSPTEKDSSDLSGPDDGITMPLLLSVDAGLDRAEFEPFMLNAKAEGQTKVAWSVVRGVASNVAIENPQALSTKVAITGAPGVYAFRVTVTDSGGATKFDELVIEWGGDHYIFTTSLSYNGNLGGLKGADTKCNDLARAAGLKGTYTALLSTSTVNAKDRVKLFGRVLRVDGVLIANNAADLWDGAIASTLQVDEAGKPTVANVNQTMWTGSLPSGVLNNAANTCSDWTSTAGDSYIGLNYYSDGFWMNYTTTIYGCTNSEALYCLSTTPSLSAKK